MLQLRLSRRENEFAGWRSQQGYLCRDGVFGYRKRQGLLRPSPACCFDPFDFPIDVLTFEERLPSAKCLCFPGVAIGEFGVGVQARARRICPCAIDWLPGTDDPARFVGRRSNCVSRDKLLVVIGLLIESFRAFEHYAVLNSQIAELCICSVLQPHRHFNVVGQGSCCGAEFNAIG